MADHCRRRTVAEANPLDSTSGNVVAVHAATAAVEALSQEGRGEVYGRRADLRLARKAMRQDWPITPDIRERVVAAALGIMSNPAVGSQRQLAAARLLVAADSVNARREATAVTERQGEVSAATQVLRAALASPEARQALASLSESASDQAPSDQ